MRLRLGTRGSALALRQSGLVAAELERRGTAVELITIRTTGDVLTGSLVAAGGKGLFVKEIEEALLAGSIDLAVHSLKDLPAVVPPGLALVATPAREDPRDVLISPGGGGVGGLPSGARVGTSSLRRRALLLARRADLRTVPLRGNVDTRLRKLAEGEVDAVVLAAAGLRRLALEPPGTVVLSADEFVPAIGQGALALEARADDTSVRDLVAVLDDPPSASAVAAERAFLRRIGGDCQTPLAAHAHVEGDRLRMRALVAEIDGSAFLEDTSNGAADDGVAIGERLADTLLDRGAAAMIARARALAPGTA